MWGAFWGNSGVTLERFWGEFGERFGVSLGRFWGDFGAFGRIGVSVKQQFTEEEIYKDRDSQIAAIEKTFEDAQKPVRVWGFWGILGGRFWGILGGRFWVCLGPDFLGGLGAILGFFGWFGARFRGYLGRDSGVCCGVTLGGFGWFWGEFGRDLGFLVPEQITQHYSKPRVTPLEVMPVFPDFKVGLGAPSPLYTP